MDKEQKASVVIDTGSGTCKVGIAGEDAPSAVFATVIGLPTQNSIHAGMGKNEVFVGDQAENMRNVLNLKYPIKHGVVVDWDSMEKLWLHCYADGIKISSDQQPCLMAESPLTPKANRQKTIQIMFETFNVPAFYLSAQANMALYSVGRTTGIVIDSGFGLTHTAPVYEGYMLPHATLKINQAGAALDQHFQKILNDKLPNPIFSPDIIRQIKQKECYVALDYDQQMTNFSSSPKNSQYNLPDGQLLIVGNQKFRGPQVLFKPALSGSQSESWHQLLFNSIMKCDVDIRRQLYENMALSGGNTLFPGIAARIHREITALAPATMKIRVVATPQRKYSVWIGGSILASLSTFPTLWITRQEYEESGPSIVHKKCL